MAAVVVTLAAGCSTTSDSTAPRSAPGSSPSSSIQPGSSGLGSRPDAGSSAEVGSGDTAAPGHPAAPRCRSAALHIRLATTGGGMGRRYAAIEVTNSSSATCSVTGFVGLRLLDQDGRSLPTEVVPDKVAAAAVVLAPKRSAWVTMSWTVIPAEDEAGSNPCQPPASALEVTVPDAGPALRVDFSAGSVCQGGRLTVGPLSSQPPA